MSLTKAGEMGRARPLPRDFRVLWAAQGVSAFGSSMAYVATPWLAYSLTHSGVGTAATTACAIAPYPVLGVIAGVLVDGFPQRTVMLVADLLSALAKLLGPLVAGVVLAAAGAAPIFAVNAASCLVGALGSILLTTRGSGLWRPEERPRVGDGLVYLFRHLLIRSLTVATTFVAVGIGAFEAVLVPLLRGGFGYRQIAVGGAYAAGGLGWLVGALLVGRARVSATVPPLVVGALAAAAVAGALFALIACLPVTLAAIAV